MKREALDSAQREATWDEDRLTKLMEKTLDNYIAKKKKEKVPTNKVQLTQPQAAPPLQAYAQPQQQPYYPPQTQQPRFQQQAQPRFEDNPFGRFMN